MANTRTQRYSASDTSTDGVFVFDDDASGNDIALTKIAFGADGADPTRVTASVGMPVTILAGAAAIGSVTVTGTVTVGAHAVTNAGTFPVQESGTALTRLTDIETNTDSLAVVGNGAAATAVRVTLANDSTGIVALTTSSATIGKLAANSGVDIGDVDIASIAAGDNNIGNVDIVTVPADPFGANADAASATGSISAKLRFIASTGIPITGTVTVGAHAVTNAGTFAVQESGTALTRLTDIETNTDSCAVVGNGAAATAQRVTIANDSTGILAGVTTVTTVTTCSTVTTLTGGGVAHDGADSGNPLKIGMKATTSLSGLTLVANADRTDTFAGIDGVPIVRGDTNLEDIVTGLAAITDGSSTSVISAAGAGVKIYIKEIVIANSSSTNVTVDLRDGTAGSVKATLSCPANSGSHKTLSVPLPFSANTAVAADPSAAASTVTVTLIGFKSKI